MRLSRFDRRLLCGFRFRRCDRPIDVATEVGADFRRSFARTAALRADVVLPFHPEGADVIVDFGNVPVGMSPSLVEGIKAVYGLVPAARRYDGRCR